jgi:hydrogenase maturation protease
MKILVIGYGNTLRSDDGAGQLVAQLVNNQGWLNVEALWVHQLTPELAEELKEVELAIFVDAYLAGENSESSVLNYELIPDPQSPISNPLMGHTSDPRSLLALAHQVYGFSPTAWHILVPAINLDLGEDLSPVTERGISAALVQIERMITEAGE